MTEHKSKNQKRFKIAEYLGVIILLACLTWFLLWPAYENVRDSFRASQWPSVNGRVVESQRRTSNNGSGRMSISYRFGYEYQVDGKTYRGNRYSLRYPSGDRSTGVDKHRAGEQIKVHYDPNSPARSAIDVRSSAWWNYLVLGFSALILFMVVIAVSTRTPTGEDR